MKKFPLLATLLLTGLISFSQTPTLEKIWTTDTLLKTPESVLFDAKEKLLYVSNIDGNPAEKDGKGSIAKVGLDGKIIAAEWVKGLHAPKGMGLFKNKLYVADLTDVVVIDVQKGSIEQRIPVNGANFLNDITIDNKGIVYVSDSRTFKVHRIENGTVFTQVEKLVGPNGLLAVKDNLFILDRGSLLLLLPDGKMEKLADGMDPGTDGIEKVKDNEYIVSCWGGVVYYVYANGQKQILLDTRNEKINSADIGYDAKKKIVYVPTFYKNTVVAYQLK